VFCIGDYTQWVTNIMNDATVRSMVGVTSHSYQQPSWGIQCRAAYPNIPFFETEAIFGPGPPGDNVQDWGRGLDEFRNVADFMLDSTSVYTMWNMVNDQTGQSGWGWAQNLMIQVNSSTHAVTYNPHFYAYKHYGNYVKPGAFAIRRTITGTNPDRAVAFRNPNGDIILVIGNSGTGTFALTVKVGTMMWRATLPATSFNTLRIASGTAVQERKLENIATPALSNARISNSMLYFTVPASLGALEMDMTLTDLQGRTVWTGHRGGTAILGGQQSFTVRSERGNLRSGTYLLTVRIKDRTGAVSTVENKVAAAN
jgi:hypothetical protein